MDNEYLKSGQLRLSYQLGKDSVKRSFILPRWSFVVLIILGLFLLVSTVMLYVMIGGISARSVRLERLEAENTALRSKVDYYAAAIDSIYIKLDSLATTASNPPADYPSLSFGKQKAPFAFDPTLETQITTLETKLAYIMQRVTPASTYETHTLAELLPGELPPDYMPSIYPTFGRISDSWGLRVHPISNEIEFHYGLDIANQPGTPIYSTASGTVVTTDFDTGYGKRIIINHGNGYATLYAHLYSYMVRIGDPVGKGQIIGLMGNSGLSTGPHLHYEVRNNEAKVNPTAYLNRIDEPSYAMR